jgi:glycosyltransferase involved in cell wall biosynthesis
MAAGGAERVTATLAGAWAEAGHEVHLITLEPLERDFYPLHPRIERHALDLAGVSRNILHAIGATQRRVRTLRRLFRDIRPHVVVGMATTPAVLTVLSASGLGIRVVVEEHIHPPMKPLGRVWELARRWTYGRTARVVVLTSEGLEWLRATIPRATGMVIPNPVAYPAPVTDPVVDPASIVPDGRRLLLAVGRLYRQKGFDLLVPAFASLADAHPDWDLVILGDGPERASLEALVVAAGMEGRVRLPGVVGNVAHWYERADLYVMSSRFEGFPMTLTEALASGCPAVSYDCDTGPRDLLSDGVSGLLVRPVGDVQALATGLATLMGDEETRRRMASQAIGVRERYSLERILARWDDALGVVPGRSTG